MYRSPMHEEAHVTVRTRVLSVGAAALLVIACSSTASPAPGSPGRTAGPAAAGPIRLVVDTDMAPDDVTAITSLVRDPRVELLAITVVGTGEAHCPNGMFVARSVLTMLGVAPIPVACGRATAIGPARPFPDEWRDGADVANGLRLAKPDFLTDSRPAEQVLVDLAATEASAGRILTILTLGTLTNLADAASLDSAFPGRVRVVSMLGAIGVAGNAAPNGEPAPTAEWNAHADPTAVRDVLAAGFDLTLVPLDATRDAPLSRPLYDQLASDHAAGPADLVYELWSLNPFMLDGGYDLWDPLASAVVRDPSIVSMRTTKVRVIEGDGLDGGRLVEDPAGASVTYATSADRGRFEALLLGALRLGAPRADPFNPVGTISVAAGPGTCDVVAPNPVPRGLVQLQLTAAGTEPTQARIFGTNGIAWADVEAFAANPDFDHAPDVQQFAAAFVDAPGSTSAYGNVTAGPIGIACAIGDFDSAAIELRGPFQVAP
jgi:pyrimidine-specific ribonucleoside hydrolase